MLGDLNAALWWPFIDPHLPWAQQKSSGPVTVLLRGLPHDGLLAFEIALDSCEEGPPDVSQKIEEPFQARYVADAWSGSSWSGLLRKWAEARESNRGQTDEGFLGRSPSVWLEFDLGRESRPDPLLCLELPRSSGPSAPWLGHLAPAAGPDLLRAVERCRDALPDGARIMYLFDLGARRPGAVRLEPVGLDAEQIPAYLERIGAETPSWLAEWTATAPIGERPHLSFDLLADGSITDRVGLEISFRRLPRREPRWSRLFDRLEADGLCLAPRREVCLAWPAQARRATSPVGWPESPDLERGHAVRVLSHVKLVGNQDSVRAKAYLLFRYLAPGRSEPSGDQASAMTDSARSIQ